MSFPRNFSNQHTLRQTQKIGRDLKISSLRHSYRDIKQPLQVEKRSFATLSQRKSNKNNISILDEEESDNLFSTLYFKKYNECNTKKSKMFSGFITMNNIKHNRSVIERNSNTTKHSGAHTSRSLTKKIRIDSIAKENVGKVERNAIQMLTMECKQAMAESNSNKIPKPIEKVNIPRYKMIKNNTQGNLNESNQNIGKEYPRAEHKRNNRSNHDIYNVIKEIKENENADKVNKSVEFQSPIRTLGKKQESISTLSKLNYQADQNISELKHVNVLDLSQIDSNQEVSVLHKHEFIKNEEQKLYEDEMIGIMKTAKQKVQNLANKLKLAKNQIVKLKGELQNKDKLLSDYHSVNQNLLTRISSLESEITFMKQSERNTDSNLLSTQELKKMIEESLNEINNESDHNFYREKEIVNLKKKLKQLKNDEKFRYFLKLNDLDPVKILSMPNEESKLNSQLVRCSTKESLDTITESVFENIELRLDDYVMFSYIPFL